MLFMPPVCERVCWVWGRGERIEDGPPRLSVPRIGGTMVSVVEETVEQRQVWP